MIYILLDLFLRSSTHFDRQIYTFEKNSVTNFKGAQLLLVEPEA